MARIGFIGLGNMGLPMAQNLLKAGHAVAGFDLNVDASERLTASGGTRSNAVADACKDAEVVITMLPAGEHVRDVYLGDACLQRSRRGRSSSIPRPSTWKPPGRWRKPPRAGDFPWSTRPCPAAWPAPRRQR